MQDKIKLLLYTIAIVAIIGIFTAFPKLAPTGSGRKLINVISRNETIVAEVADTMESRAKGLSGRSSLGFNRGMIFIFPELGNYGFWMTGMKFPIDIVWINDERVVGLTENIDPQIGIELSKLNIYYPPEPVNRVLELPAGKAKFLELKVNDSLDIIGL